MRDHGSSVRVSPAGGPRVRVVVRMRRRRRRGIVVVVVIVRRRKHGSRRRRVVAGVLVVMLIRVWVRRSRGEDDAIGWRFCRRRWRERWMWWWWWSGGWKGVASTSPASIAAAAADVSHERLNFSGDPDDQISGSFGFGEWIGDQGIIGVR